MDERMRWPMVNLTRAGIFFVVGVVGVALGAAADFGVFSAIGGFALFIGVLYLLAGLVGISKALLSDD